MDGSPNPEFIRKNNLKAISHPVEFVDALFCVYKQKNIGHQKTPSLLSTEDFLKWSNEKAIDMWMGDTCYPNFVPFIMDLFEHHLYLYYSNGINPYPRIQMKFKSSSADPVQGNDFPHKSFGHNSVRQHKQFKCWFACHDLRKPIPTLKLYPSEYQRISGSFYSV